MVKPSIIRPMLLTLKHMFKRPVTVKYPFETMHYPAAFRGVPSVIKDLCTGCGRCIEACPNKAMEFEEVDGKKIPLLNVGRCMFCGLCLEACPTGARVNTPIFEISEYTREDMVWDVDRLSAIADQEVDLSRDMKRDIPGVDEDMCIACLRCENACNFEALSHRDRGTKRTLKIDFDRCVSCLHCVEACPVDALTIKEGVLVKKGESLSWSHSIPENDLGTEKYFQLLEEKVIKGDYCCHCTACVAACPVGIIKGKDKAIHVENIDECVNCGLCVRVCPRYTFSYDYTPPSGWGDHLEVFSTSSTRFSGQDGGMVTELLVSAMEMGMIDLAIVVDRDEEWKPVLRFATTPEEIVKSAGTKYTLADVLSGLRTASRISSKIAVVGTPCQIEGLRKMEEEVPHLASKVKLAISLFCTENFYHKELFGSFLKTQKIKPKDVIKSEFKKGKFIVNIEGHARDWPAAELIRYAFHGCECCHDLVGVFSDVSVGGIGSEFFYSTIIVRRENAKKLLDYTRKKGNLKDGVYRDKSINFMLEYKKKIHTFIPGEKEK